MPTNRPLSPHLQVYRWEITMVLSILHRASGVFLSVGLFMLVYWLISIARGPEAYMEFAHLMSYPIPKLALFAWTVALFYHLGNGIRHLLWDAGWGFEIPQVYLTGWSVVIFTIAATGVAWYWAWVKLGGLS
ncbi:MAG: succinate dehydrogenase, cytochrome b556 subunit [Gammaproteobacteria bacterium]|nr:succinate dehydrogenase, cytochrome b556 subunit [Gammaproteobacteria bacterium]